MFTTPGLEIVCWDLWLKQIETFAPCSSQPPPSLSCPKHATVTKPTNQLPQPHWSRPCGKDKCTALIIICNLAAP